MNESSSTKNIPATHTFAAMHIRTYFPTYLCMRAICTYIHILSHTTTIRTCKDMERMYLYMSVCVRIYIYTHTHTYAHT